MSQINLLQSALLLGVYVTLAGGYGLLYTVARLQHAIALQQISFALYGLHGLAAIALVGWTPLQMGWKGLVIVSSAAFLAIPPITWRFLQRTHENEV